MAAVGRDAGGESDPFAWKPERREDLEERASAGLSHVLYANSPGGVLASAKRTDRWREEIEAAAKASGTDPDQLEAMVFLESAGRPDVIAGTDVEDAAGLTQILASTGIDLLGMEIDVKRSEELTKKAAKASEKGDEAEYRRLLRERAEVDERFDPVEALAATGRYLTTARESFAEDDLAVVSYHMGIGNLEDVIQAYAGSDAPARELVESGDLSYAQLFFDSSPTRNPEAWSVLSEFADDSATYLWRVLAAEEIMRLYRDDPAELERLADLQTAKATQEEVLHPASETEVFEDPGAIAEATEAGELVAIPADESLGFKVVEEQLGELAPKLGTPPETYRALRPEALAALIYLSSQVKEASGAAKPLKVTSAVRDLEYQEHARRPQPGGDQRVLAAHDRLLLRHPARLRIRCPGGGVPVRARPPAGPERPRLRVRAGGDPRHRRPRRRAPGRMSADWKKVCELGGELPEVEESTSYGTPL